MACETAQNFCATNQSAGISFSWGQPVENNSLISISAASYNSLFQQIVAAYNKGATVNGGSIAAETVKPGDTISAAKINSLANALWGLGGFGAGDISKVQVDPGDLISADIFKRLEKAANNLQLKVDQCDSCNTAQSCAAASMP